MMDIVKSKATMNMKKDDNNPRSHDYGSIPIVSNDYQHEDEEEEQQPLLLPHRRTIGMRDMILSIAVVAAMLFVVVGYSSPSPFSFSSPPTTIVDSTSTTVDSTSTTTTHINMKSHPHWHSTSTSSNTSSTNDISGKSVIDILLDPAYDEMELFYNEQFVDHIYVDTEHGEFQEHRHHQGPRLSKYSHRYYKKSQHWGGPGHPILMILGGEDALDLPMLYPFVNTGLAAKFQAFVLSPEHRFYGKSQPLKNPKIPEDLIKYLTPDQALLDFVNLVQYMREQLGCDEDRTSPNYCPVITFGGSYPGFLSTMMRFRFPDIVDIGYAASAPLELYSQVVDSNAYYDKVSEVADVASPGCADAVRNTLYSVRDYLLDNDFGGHIAHEMHNVYNAARDIGVCTDTLPRYITEDNDVYTLASEAVVYLVPAIFADFNMAFYPPSFGKNITGSNSTYKVLQKPTALDQACAIFQDELTSPFDKMKRFYDLRNRVEYGDPSSNSTDNEMSCFDITLELPAGQHARIMGADWSGSGGGLTGEIWEFQCCKDLVIRTGYSDESMFIDREFSYFWHQEHCHERFPGVPVEPFRMVNQWHFDQITKTGSKILFTNGLNDGWSTSSILDVEGNPDLAVINFPNGAHHSELGNNWPNDHDTDDIRAGYDTIMDILAGWLNEITGTLPEQNVDTTTNSTMS